MPQMLESGASFTADYTLNEFLGRGAFGEVWSATGQRGDPVAIKVLQTHDQWAQRRFEREVEALSRLDHRNCVRLIRAGVWQERPFLVTELIEGITLAQWLERPRGLPMAVSVGRQIAEAATYAHEQGVLHRDLKPQNVLIEQPNTEDPRVRVVDFGMAKLTGARATDITKTGHVIGTPGYMSPEQLRGARDFGPGVDVYALGVMLFQMFEGRAPFVAASALEVAMKHLTDTTPQLSAVVAADLRALVADMLEKAPEDRPAMSVVAEVLAGESYEPPPTLVEVQVRTPAAPRPKASMFPFFGALVLIAALTGVAMAVLLPRAEPPTPAPPPARPQANVATLLRATDVRVDRAAAPTDVSRAMDFGRASPGCGRSSPVGLQTFGGVMAGLDVLVWLPSGYDPNRPAASIMLFHDVTQTPSDMMKIAPLLELAERENLVLIAPSDRGITDIWTEPSDADRGVDEFAQVGERLCLDLDRLFVIGHGNGAIAAEYVGCGMRPIAIALTSHRHWRSRAPCPNGPVPTLLVSPLADPAAPVDGGIDCLNNNTPWPLDKQERDLKKKHSCHGKKRPAPGQRGCFTAKCGVDLVWCRVQGGRDWHSMPERLGMVIGPCISPRAEFDHVARIWQFFSDTAAGR